MSNPCDFRYCDWYDNSSFVDKSIKCMSKPRYDDCKYIKLREGLKSLVHMDDDICKCPACKLKPLLKEKP